MVNMTDQKYHHNSPDSRTGAKVDYEARKELQSLPTDEELHHVRSSLDSIEAKALKEENSANKARWIADEKEKEKKEINDDGSSHDTIDDDLTHLKAVKEEIKQKENVKIKSKETESELLGLWVEETNLEKKIMNTKSKRPRTEHEIKELEANRKKLIGEANTSLHLVSSHDTEE